MADDGRAEKLARAIHGDDDPFIIGAMRRALAAIDADPAAYVPELAAAVTKLDAIRVAYDNAPLADISDCSGATEWMQLVADIGDILDGQQP